MFGRKVKEFRNAVYKEKITFFSIDLSRWKNNGKHRINLNTLCFSVTNIFDYIKTPLWSPQIQIFFQLSDCQVALENNTI